MPTILNENGFRFFFYSSDRSEPAHIHVEKGDAEGKIWLEPKLRVAYMHDFTSTEAKQVMVIVFKHYENFKKEWHGYFGK